MADLGRDWMRIVRQRYRFALLVLAVLWSAGSILSFRLTYAERERAELIALATEQAALSQRIAFLSSSLDRDAVSCTDPDLCQRLLRVSEQMERNHELLTGTSEDERFAHFLPPLRSLYDAGEVPFREEVQSFLDASCQLARDALRPDVDRAALIDRISESGTSTIMQTHMLLVEVLEAEAQRAIDRIGFVTALIWAASLGMILAVSGVIFRPMSVRMGRMLNAMEQAQQSAVDAAAAAEDANRARGQFLRTASHELKTPLNAIMGIAEVLREDGDQADRLLVEMEHASDHLLSMLNTMLDTHRMDEGRLRIQAEPASLQRELLSIQEIGRGLAERKGLGFESIIDIPADAFGMIDAMRFREICINLIDNAVRYTDQGSVEFRVAISNAASTPALTVTISDTGAGISEEACAALFDRSGRRQLNPGQGGMGLGLILSKTLVELMGGDMEVSSQVGRGSRFRFSIPVPAASGPVVKNVSGDARVLIVDDNPPNRLVADAMMTMLGSTNTLTEDGQQAVDCAMREPFDLILMDIAMPVMDGLEAARIIRCTPGPNQATPIIAVTAHAAPEDVSDMLHQGFQAVVHKPMRKAMMTELYDRYVGSHADQGTQEKAG